MGNVAILGIPNVVHPQWLQVSAAGFASTSYHSDNLGTDEASESWRSASASPYETMLYAYRTYGSTHFTAAHFDAIGLAAVNLSRAALVRVLGLTEQSNIIAALGIKERAPTSLEASTNITGTYTDVDEGLTTPSDGNRIVPTTPANAWSARFGFATPPTAPATGENKQAFVARVSLSAALASVQHSPTITASLYEGGVLVRNLGTKHVTATDQFVIWSWDASELATATGADVEVLLESTPINDGSTKYVQLEILGWFVEDEAFESANTEFDTGWFAPLADPTATALGGFLADDAEPQQSVLKVLDAAATSCAHVWVLIRDDQAPTDVDTEKELIRAADGYVEVGRLVIGKVFRPTYNIEWGDLLGVIDLSEVAVTDGGQTFGQKKARLRTISLPLNWLTQSEAIALFDRLLWRKGRLSPVLISAIPDSATEGRHTTLWARLDGASALATRQAFDTTGSLRGLSLNFVEVL